MTDFITCATGSVVGPRHILTAAHVCRQFYLKCRQEKAYLFCIPGLHGPFFKPSKDDIKTYPISAFRVSRHSLFAYKHFKNVSLDAYDSKIKRTLMKTQTRSADGRIEEQSFFDHDVGMYFLGEDLPASMTRALVRSATDAELSPERKLSLKAHGYTYGLEGLLRFADTYPIRTWPSHFALHDAPLGGGASGGPVWIHKKGSTPEIIAIISGVKRINIGGPVVGWDPSLGGDGLFFEDPKTGKTILVRNLKEKPKAPIWARPGIASRLTGQTHLEIKRWLRKRR